MQARTSALISQVEEEILPRLKEEEEGLGENNGHAAKAAALDPQQGERGKEDSTAALMQDLKLSDKSTFVSGVAKELRCAKECLERAETMLLVSLVALCFLAAASVFAKRSYLRFFLFVSR